MRITSLSACLWLVLCVFLAGTGQAKAEGAGDALFKQVKDALAGSVKPDAIAMARFSIAHPSEAATVYSRAAAQDYPFFAMVGAAKAAKDRDFPGIGKFTMAACLSPITAIDSVFAKADSTITNTQGKASTNAAMATASGIAASYAKAQTAEAKKQLVEQLSQTVPYFGDIPTICLFAFDTDLEVEKDVHMVADQVSQDIRSAYVAFKSGDVVTGTEVLLSLGAGKAVVCQMVDNAVGGGIIGRTPLLGTLAKGACAGFVGAVIDGVTGLIKGGVGLAEKGVVAIAGAGKAAACAVYSLIGSGCSSAEPPPPTALGNAAAWCAARGGIAAFKSKSNQPDDYSLVCNDGAQCKAKPGGYTACATAAEMAAHKAQQIANAEIEFQAKLPQWQAEFDSRWLGKCPDGPCKASIGQIRASATQLAKEEHVASPHQNFAFVTHFIFEAADRQAVSVLDEHSYRVLPGQWAAAFVKRGNQDCEDDICRTGVRIASLNVLLQMQQRAAATPRPPYGSSAAIYALAETQHLTLVAESAKRGVEFNKTNTANASVAWEILTNAIWGKQCMDVPCVAEVKQLSSQMRIAANLVQLAHPDQSSMKVQGTVGGEYGPKFKAAVVASKERAARQVPVVAQTSVRAVGPLRPFMQRARFATPKPAPDETGRPAPRQPQSPVPPGRPGPIIKVQGGKTVSIQAGTDRMGSDYRGFALDQADPQLCRQACADEAVCRSYTYVNPGLKGPKAMCFLKNAAPPASPNACCTSGEVTGDGRR
jgi:hypothetical protein